MKDKVAPAKLGGGGKKRAKNFEWENLDDVAGDWLDDADEEFLQSLVFDEAEEGVPAPSSTQSIQNLAAAPLSIDPMDVLIAELVTCCNSAQIDKFAVDYCTMHVGNK